MNAFVSIPALLRCSSSLLSNNFVTSSRPISTRKRTQRQLIPRCSIQSEQENKVQLSTGYGRKIDLDGRAVAYDYFPGTSPTIVFLPGFFVSRWNRAKANALEIFAKRKGQAVFVEEYRGIGLSEGDFVTDGTLSRWIEDSLQVIDKLLPGKVVLVGAGVGGWIALHLAMKRSDRVVGIVALNPSVDFTEDLIRPKLSQEQRESIEKSGFANVLWGFKEYVISKAFLEDAKNWLVMRGGTASLDVTCPVRILQGLDDEELPPRRMLDLVDKIKSEDCVLSYIKFSDHSMEEKEDLSKMWNAVCDVSDTYFEYDLTTTSSG